MPYKQETGDTERLPAQKPYSRGSVSAWTVAGAWGRQEDLWKGI